MEAASLTLAWDPPTDSSDVAGYIVWYGTASGVYATRLDVGLTTSRKIEGLSDSTTYYFAVQAYNAAGEIGELSDQIAGATAPPAGGSGGTGQPPGTPAAAPVINVRENRFLDVAWLPGAGATAYRVEVGTSPGNTSYSAVTVDASISFDTANHPAAAYFVRVRPIVGGVPGTASAETSIAPADADASYAPAQPSVAACVAGPSPARQFVNAVTGNAVRLSWQPGGGPLPTGYVLEVGSRPGIQDLMTVPLGGAMTGVNATAGNGLYSVRLVSMNACGASVWAPETLVQVGTPVPLPTGPAPGQPPSLTQRVEGGVVTLVWTPPASGGAVTRYLVEAITPFGPFSYDTGNPGTLFTNANTPPGEYVVTVRAGNGAGFGPASAAVRVVVR